MKHNVTPPTLPVRKVFKFAARGRAEQELEVRSLGDLATALEHQGLPAEVVRHVAPLAWHRQMRLVDREWQLTYYGNFEFKPAVEVKEVPKPKQRQPRSKGEPRAKTPEQRPAEPAGEPEAKRPTREETDWSSGALGLFDD